MRLPGDSACVVELDDVQVLSDSRGTLTYVRGGGGTAARGAGAGAWTVTVNGGDPEGHLRVGDTVIVLGRRRGTGERFTVPGVLVCTAASGQLRFTARQPRGGVCAGRHGQTFWW